MNARLSAGTDPIADYPDGVFFGDMWNWKADVNIFLRYRELYNYYPDAYYVLNVRPVDKQVESMMAHRNGFMRDGHMKMFGVTEKELRAHWRAEIFRHRLEVLKFFSDRPGKLLVFHIEDGPKDLIDFVAPDFDLNADHWEVIGRRNEVVRDYLG